MAKKTKNQPSSANPRDPGLQKSLKTQSAPVIVLGMHRSGTSALAAGLQHLGLVMGKSLYEANEWNPKGYFEDRDIVEFNNRLLQQLDRRWDSPLPPLNDEHADVELQIREATVLLQEHFGTATNWGFKDPRMCLLASVWAAVFVRMGVVPRLLLTVRNPRDVAQSLARRDGISVERAGWSWLTHLIGALEFLKLSSDARFVAFDKLLSHPKAVLMDIASWLDLTPDAKKVDDFSSEFILPELAHKANPSVEEPPQLVSDAYDLLCRALEVGLSPKEFSSSAEWQKLLKTFYVEFLPILKAAQSLDRQEQIQAVENRLQRTDTALNQASALSLERLEQLQALEARLSETDTALNQASALSLERLEQLQALEARLSETELTKAVAEEKNRTLQSELDSIHATKIWWLLRKLGLSPEGKVSHG